MIPPRSELNRLHANICTGLADPVRIAILYLLEDGEANVTTLIEHLELPQSTVSRHLRVLRTSHLVNAERRGQHIYYRLTDERVIGALNTLRAVLQDRMTARARAFDGSTQEEDSL